MEIVWDIAETLCDGFVGREADMADQLRKQSPWAEYAMCVKALFDHDEDVLVEYDNDEPSITLYVDNPIKADALTQMQAKGIFPAERQYGNVTLKIEIMPENDEPRETNLYEAAFNGNPVFDGIASVEQPGLDVDYALFAPVAVQYYSDDLSEFGGVTTTTYGDLAKRVFDAKNVRISSSHLEDIVF